MEKKYIKNKESGLVIDVSSDFDEYLLKKERAKKLQSTSQEIATLKKEVKSFKKEFSEVKELLKQLIESN